MGESLNHIHQNTKSVRLIAVCKRSFTETRRNMFELNWFNVDKLLNRWRGFVAVHVKCKRLLINYWLLINWGELTWLKKASTLRINYKAWYLHERVFFSMFHFDRFYLPVCMRKHNRFFLNKVPFVEMPIQYVFKPLEIHWHVHGQKLVYINHGTMQNESSSR